VPEEAAVARTQPLAFPIRLPDALQEEALRLLDASCTATSELVVELWPALDRFAAERTGPAWKQVEQYATRRSGHGNRQERCEMEQAGRILRAQATRKQVFQTILPLLTAGLIRPADGKRPAKKDYRLIREQVRALRGQQQEAGEEADAFMAMTNLIEPACNFYLETGAFPTTYEEMQAIPVRAARPIDLCRRRWHASWSDLSGPRLGGPLLRPANPSGSASGEPCAQAARAQSAGHLGLGRLECRDPLACCCLCPS
jgi:hypothetical protein